VEVELDVFSGRPNPRWSLDPVVAERLAAVLHALSTEGGRPSRGGWGLPGLGYRGFVVHTDGVVWRAWRGLLIGDSELVDDPPRSVERLLVANLPEEHRGLAPRLEAEIDRSPTDRG
jgi:hypothetical protein